MPTRHADVLVVGQGLAGTQIALTLLQRGLRVLVADPGHQQAASRVAAGVLNPVTGQRLVLTWQAHLHLPFAKQTYRTLERLLQTTFLREMPIRRLIRSEAELTRWHQRQTDPAYASFLGPYQPPGSLPHQRDTPFGSCAILGAAVLDTPHFLTATRQWLQTEGLLHQTHVTPRDLRLHHGLVTWRGLRFDRIVFCQGWGARNNPWFSHLPFQWAKGEILGLHLPDHGLNEILNREKWILPENPNQLRVGSTFQWNPIDHHLTPAAKRELLRATTTILRLSSPPNVLTHQVGIRPCSHDTRPYLGPSPHDPRLWIANGFGAKGALTTPLCAARLADALTETGSLHPDEHISRCTPPSGTPPVP
ncbi:MAG: FAD-binding oxidoreductase [Verrucomicrobiia bacterium]